MNLRRRINQEPIQLQLAPMIDVILFLLCFFLLTWNLARYEQDLEVKVPVARNGIPPKQLPGEVIINLKPDGKGGAIIELERSALTPISCRKSSRPSRGFIRTRRSSCAARRMFFYKDVVKVLDVCRAAKLTNIAFATNRAEKSDQ